MAYNYIDSTGVTVADTSNIKDEVTQEYKDNFGQDLVVENGSIASIMIAAETINRVNTQETLAKWANQINPSFAGGIFLDAIWAITNGQRRQATSTIVTATITGVAGTVIPAGSVAETNNQDIFLTIEEVTIQASGTIDVIFASEDKGAIQCQAGELNTIADGGVLGWETVNNVVAGVLGLETQSDASSRIDRKLTLAIGSKAVLQAITSGLYAIDDVKSLAFRENIASTTQVIDGITMVSHSIYLCVDGGTNDEIAQTLIDYKTVGAGYNHGLGINETVIITNPDTEQEYQILFDRPNEISFKIRITARATSSTINPTTAIKESVLSYANSDSRGSGFGCGVSVSPLEIAAEVALKIGYFVSDCEVTKTVDNTYQRETIPIELYEKATTSEALIEVVLV